MSDLQKLQALVLKVRRQSPAHVALQAAVLSAHRILRQGGAGAPLMFGKGVVPSALEAFAVLDGIVDSLALEPLPRQQPSWFRPGMFGC